MYKKIPQICSFLSILVFIAGAGYVAPVRAQGEAAITFNEDNYTDREKVGLAFFSMSERRPNIKAWIRKSEKYRTARPLSRQKYLTRDKDRLNLGLLLFDPEKHFFDLNARVAVTWPDEAQKQAYIAENGKFPLAIHLLDMKEHIFPVSLGHDWVVVVPGNMTKFLTFHVTPEDFEKKIVNFQNFIGYRRVEGFMRLNMKAVRVDDGTPLALNDIEAWLLLAEIRRLTLSPDRQSPPVWEQRASWDE